MLAEVCVCSFHSMSLNGGAFLLLFPSYWLEDRCNDWGSSNHFDHELTLEMEFVYGRAAQKRSLLPCLHGLFPNLALATSRLLDHQGEGKWGEKERETIFFLFRSFLSGNFMCLVVETNFGLQSHFLTSTPFTKVKPTFSRKIQVLHHWVLPYVLHTL